MSNNELRWWQAYSSLRPLSPSRQDITEARIVGALAGKKAQNVLIDWFDKENDPEYKKQVDAEILTELRELRAKREAENVKAD